MNNQQVPTINLIPADQVHHRLQARWISRWVAMVVVTAIIVGIPGLYIGGSAALTDSGMSRQIEEANIEYARHQQALPILRAKLNALAAEQEVHDFVRGRIEWRDVFAVLVNASNNEVRFQRLSASGGGVEGDQPIEISIEGLAPSQTIARAYVVDIENANIFDSIELVETTREQIRDTELIRFRITLTVLGEKPPAKEPSDAG